MENVTSAISLSTVMLSNRSLSSPTWQSTCTPYQAPQYLCYKLFISNSTSPCTDLLWENSQRKPSCQTFWIQSRVNIYKSSQDWYMKSQWHFEFFSNLSALFCLLLSLLLFLLLLLVFAVFVSFSVTRRTEPIDFTRVIYDANAGSTTKR